jgi:hypothetical protein
VNDVQVGSYQWTDCEPWSAQVDVPPDLVRAGANAVTLNTAYSARPVDVTNGENQDPRSLSLGLTRLHVGAAP